MVRDKDWAATALGPRQSWPRSLHNHLSMIFELPTAAIIFWGPSQVQLYNDGYSVIMGPRHPQYLGATFRECWPEAYDTIHPWMRRVLEHGETVAVNRTLVPLTRYGFTEEAYFTFSFSPLRDDAGRIAGVLQIVTEVTDAVLSERRTAVLHQLSNHTTRATTSDDALRLATDVLGDSRADLPFSIIYLVDPSDKRRFVLSASTGDHALPKQIDLDADSASPVPDLARMVCERKSVVINDFAAHIDSSGAARSEPSILAVAEPIAAADQHSVAAILVAGISRSLRLDRSYHDFLELVAGQLATLLMAAQAREDERRRAEALAEIDRAKTEFFSNVSHEFRTPLTLILGPVEDALTDPSKALAGDALEAVHRNALRLLRLVNNLLDFARIEAGRLTSSFEPVDLALLTAGLTGSFQSLVESAGLKLRVDCPSISEPVSVDQSQWEKIVLNLMSNAFKFTFEGEITVRLRESEGQIHLSVSDTGTGIPESELPKIFDRFHRVAGARGRTFEGTGIGLALVQGLAKQHGGLVQVESVVGKGTTFTVSIPKRIGTPPTEPAGLGKAVSAPSSAASYLRDAARWSRTDAERRPATPGPRPEIAAPGPVDDDMQSRILVVDDNADMRAYLVRLLSQTWFVEAAEDGQVAFESAVRRPPDLILSDIMMPRMDGVAMLNALRANPATRTVPVMLLSARAGEEAVAHGFDTGADDYLVKPFAARELLARVRMHLEMARLRREWARELERANQELEAFSYSVSHDLRAPLRAIDGFAKILIEDYGQQLDDQASHYLGRVRTATRRMAELIDDLLELSRIARAPLNRERADVSALVRRILADLAERDPQRSVRTSIPEGLVADADPRLLAVVLENLLGNAWKFTARSDDPRIEVGRERRDEAWSFFVRDNGAGFDMAYAARLFAPFQRLHEESEFPGTGIGLATVQRVISRHGGRIWAEAAPGQGATFYFTVGEC